MNEGPKLIHSLRDFAKADVQPGQRRATADGERWIVVVLHGGGMYHLTNECTYTYDKTRVSTTEEVRTKYPIVVQRDLLTLCLDAYGVSEEQARHTPELNLNSYWTGKAIAYAHVIDMIRKQQHDVGDMTAVFQFINGHEEFKNDYHAGESLAKALLPLLDELLRLRAVVEKVNDVLVDAYEPDPEHVIADHADTLGRRFAHLAAANSKAVDLLQVEIRKKIEA